MSGEEGEQTEAYSVLTILEANNADTQALLAGEQDAQVHVEPEKNDEKRAVRVRRWYEPVETVELPRAMTPDEIQDWLADNRDREVFADYDWDAHDEKQYLDVIVNNRNGQRQFLAHIKQELQSIRTVGVEAGEKLDEIREELADAMTGDVPVEVNHIEKPESMEA